MHITVKNLGALEQASFEPGDITIICGRNNTGKTYATYALYGFLSLWKDAFSVPIPEHVLHGLFNEGAVHMDIEEYVPQAERILVDGCRAYTKRLGTVFAASFDKFDQADFSVNLGASDRIPNDDHFERKMSTRNADIFSITKEKSSTEVVVSFLVEKEKVKIPKELAAEAIADALKEIIFGHIFPNPFIASSERTGAAIFRRELNFSRNRMLEEVVQIDKNVNPMELLFKIYDDYALPVKANVEFIRKLETLSKRKSFIAEEYPQILVEFADILGGEYTVTKNNELYFIPQGKDIRLTMDESSSAVRSLLDIGFYLRHVASPGDMLIVDEPELNLHPENQRRIARLFVRLLKAGIKVFITTHSDYIIKELNTLIMLNRDSSALEKIREQYKYQQDELLPYDKIRVYIAEQKNICKEGNKRKSLCRTLTAAHIDPAFGIDAPSFDGTIDEMNAIQEAIMFTEEDIA
jgi:AAA15 family ATPase/GTPase